MIPHNAVTMTYRGEPVEIDVGMAPLMAALWDLSYQTSNCCQGEPGRRSAYVQFTYPDQMLGLMRHLNNSQIVPLEIKHDLLTVKSITYTKETGVTVEFGWEIHRNLDGLLVGVARFPAEHIATLTAVLRGRTPTEETR